MKWLRGLLLSVLALALAGVAVRMLAPLPSLENRSVSRALAETGDTALGQAIAPAVAAAPRGHSGIHPLADPAGAFAARILLARAAERSIDAQYYIWHGDLTGSLLFEELRAAADRGVRVRLLLDDNNTSGLDPVIAALDAHPNIEVRLFNPFPIRRPRLIGFLTDFSRLNRRMHNKSFTVDNQATIVGGRNIGDEYFGAGDGALFADLDVLGVGPVVADVSADFDSYWASLSSYPADRIVPAAGGPAAIASRAADAARDPAARPYLDAVRDSPFVRQLVGRTLMMEWAPTRMISDDPAKGLGRAAPEQLLMAKLKDALGEPRRTLGLVSGYFVPAKAGTEAFAALAGSGVQVTVLTNALEATDVPIVHAGYVKWRKRLLQAGVRLYEMQGSASGSETGPRRDTTGVGSTGSKLSGAGSALHAKTFTVDGRRVFIGSFNFDPRSAHLNTELGFVIESPPLAQRMQAAFERSAPARAYEVRLSPEGELYWIERKGEAEIRHATEPGTTRWQRAAVALLSLLPIEWLL